MDDLKPGDTVFVVTDPSHHMNLEEVKDGQGKCWWLNPKTKKKEDETFPIISLRKVPPTAPPAVHTPRLRW